MTVQSLTPITDEDLLERVKEAINAKGNNYNDDTITVWIENVKQDLLYAGVAENVLGSTCAVGCIAQGVNDIWVEHLKEYSALFDRMAYRLADTREAE